MPSGRCWWYLWDLHSAEFVDLGDYALWPFLWVSIFGLFRCWILGLPHFFAHRGKAGKRGTFLEGFLGLEFWAFQPIPANIKVVSRDANRLKILKIRRQLRQENWRVVNVEFLSLWQSIIYPYSREPHQLDVDLPKGMFSDRIWS